VWTLNSFLFFLFHFYFNKLLLARSLFDSREYERCADILVGCSSIKATFFRNYAKYFVCIHPFLFLFSPTDFISPENESKKMDPVKHMGRTLIYFILSARTHSLKIFAKNLRLLFHRSFCFHFGVIFSVFLFHRALTNKSNKKEGSGLWNIF
jgi:hypothetical protein